MTLPVFASVLNHQIARLGIPEACKVLNISRRTLESWRYGKPPRMVIQVGALAILEAALDRIQRPQDFTDARIITTET